MIDITMVIDEDGEWQALYVNGEKYAEGHSIETYELFSLMKEQGWIKSHDSKMINNSKFCYYTCGKDDCDQNEPTFYDKLEEYEEDDFEE